MILKGSDYVAKRDAMDTLDQSVFSPGQVVRPGFTLTVEPRLGVGKVQVHSTTPDADFRRIVGVDAPRPRTESQHQGIVFSWLSPCEWMLTGPETDVDQWISKIKANGGDEVLALDLSHARVSLVVDGPNVREVLAAVCPLDLWPDVFSVGSAARSLIGDAGMFILRLPDHAERPRFRIIVDQTMAAYAVRLLHGPTRRQESLK